MLGGAEGTEEAPQHLGGELFKDTAKMGITHVPCKGANPAVKEKWLEIGSEVVVGTPEQFDALIKTEARKMESLIKGLNIQLD